MKEVLMYRLISSLSQCRKYLITILWMFFLFVNFSNSVQPQSLNIVLKLIEDIEEKLKRLDSKQKQDIQDIQKSIVEIREENIISDINNSLEELSSRITQLDLEIENIKDIVIKTGENKPQENEIIKNLVPDLRLLMTELRETIENPPESVEEDTVIEETDSGLELFGFFDIHADRFKEADNIFGLGAFELDIEAPFSERFSGSAAMVFEDGVAEIGVGF